MCARKRTAGKQGSGRKNPHKSGRRHGTRAGNKDAERGRTSGKSRTQPPGGGSVGQTKNGGQPAGWEQGSDTPAEKTPEHRSQKPPQQRSAAQERPARHMARRAGRRKNLRTGKIRVRSFACPEGPCEPGPPKNASLFWLAQSFLLRIARSAEPKGAPSPFIPRSLLKKAGENFIVWAGCVTAARKGLQSAALPRPRRPAPPLRTPCSRRVRIPWADGATAVPMAAEAAEAAGLPVPADPSGGPTA